MLKRIIENKREVMNNLTPAEAATLKTFDDFFGTLPYSPDGLTEADLDALSIRANNVYKQLSMMTNAPLDDYLVRRLDEQLDEAGNWVKVFQQWKSQAQAMREVEEKIAMRKILDPGYEARYRQHEAQIRQEELDEARHQEECRRSLALNAERETAAAQKRLDDEQRYSDLVVEESLKHAKENPNKYLSLEDQAAIAHKRARLRYENKNFLQKLIRSK